MGDLLASLLPLFLPNSLEPLRLLDLADLLLLRLAAGGLPLLLAPPTGLLLLLLLAGGLRLLLPPPLGLLDLERGILSDQIRSLVEVNQAIKAWSF